MTKHDWEEHKKRYLEEYPELTLAAYAALFGLNPSTARRAMRGVKSAVKGNVAQQSKSQRQSDHSTGNDHLPSALTATEPYASVGTEKESKTTKSRRYRKKALRNEEAYTHNSDHSHTTIPLVENTENDHHEWITDFGNKMAQYMEPLTAQNHTGGYVSSINLDDDLLKAAIELAGDDGELVLACGRYLQLYRCKDNTVQQVKDDYANGEVWYYPGTETPMPLSMAIMQAEMAPAQRLSELERIIGNRKSAIWRRRQSEHERHPYNKNERMYLTIKILENRKKNAWSALETAQELELKGLKLPRFLELEVAREVGFIEPVTDTDGGISEAELEAQAQAYMLKQKEIIEDWLPTRRAEVAAALAAEIAQQSSELIDEDDFNPQHDDEMSACSSDNERRGEPLAEVTEAWA
ncbi:TPA: hypothetical protein ACN6VL_004249 [Aeromonas veronii]|uniref:hypothetical protein n=1 Tax=Aeromonas TaxID=642 RepID=UPI00367248D7